MQIILDIYNSKNENKLKHLEDKISQKITIKNYKIIIKDLKKSKI